MVLKIALAGSGILSIDLVGFGILCHVVELMMLFV